MQSCSHAVMQHCRCCWLHHRRAGRRGAEAAEAPVPVAGESCNHAIMQPCNHAIMQSCSHAVMQSCSHAVMQSCTTAAAVGRMRFELPAARVMSGHWCGDGAAAAPEDVSTLVEALTLRPSCHMRMKRSSSSLAGRRTRGAFPPACRKPSHEDESPPLPPVAGAA